MSSDVVILVPRREGIAERDALWAFARPYWERLGFPIFEGYHEHDEGPFNRGRAINRAAELAGDWEVAVIIDSDVVADPHAVEEAIGIARDTGRPVLAYDERVHLNARGTKAVLAGFTGSWRRQPYVGNVLRDSCSSANAIRRDLWDAVGGFDELFVGWGWEDIAFRVATETLTGDALVKVKAELWHLHHRPSSGNNREEVTFVANRARGERYVAARWDDDAMAELLEEAASARGVERSELELPVFELGPTRIPRILHRTVPFDSSDEVERFWARAGRLHPGWELRTWRDPLDAGDFPLTADLWDRCSSGAQRAGLIRLEVLWHHGGIYLDSDVELYRNLEPLLGLAGFAGFEDRAVIPDAVLGFEAHHPALDACIRKARLALEDGAGAWVSGPGVTTSTLAGRRDVLLLPPGSFYPYHYSSKAKHRNRDHAGEQPWAFGAHHWAHSWEGK